jgi:hypothetical protein
MQHEYLDDQRKEEQIYMNDRDTLVRQDKLIKQIDSLGKSVFAHLSIEELEQRLEMQVFLPNVVAPSKCGANASCGTFCSPVY